jgi:predicted DNA-binding transcriptional regulator AlpA
MNAKSQIRPRTVKLIARLLSPLSDEGIISVPEEREIISNLKHLSERGELIPNIMPKLIDQTEAAELLGISLANFKKLEREGAFSFNRRMVGSSVRYRNLDVIKYLMTETE